MVRSIEAIYANGVFVPAVPPGLPDHARVHLLVEPIETSQRSTRRIADRRQRRIQLAPELARDIATAPDFAPDEW